MRVVTLLPAATEIVAALGGAGQLVGISHECDYPPEVTGLPRVTVTPVDAEAPSAAIDAEVRRLRSEGGPVIGVDAAQLRRLDPDLLVTQGLCEVCAVADGAVHRLAVAMEPPPRVLSLAATTLAGIFGDIRAVGTAIDLADEADELEAGLRHRLSRLRARRPPGRARVVCLEWLDPLYLAGHWVPELVDAAGGEDVGAAAGSHSQRRDWRDLAALRPDFLAVMLCGFGVERARRELACVADPEALSVLRSAPVWVVDGHAYTSRPGPRVVDGVDRLQAMLYDREMPGLVRWRPPTRPLPFPPLQAS
jgi:iron complex transport system substrate-binding protein